MHLEAKALAHPRGQLAGAQLGLGGSLLLQILPHLGRQFVRLAWPTLARQEPCQTLAGKVRLRLVERRPGQPELAGGLRQRKLLLLHRPQALVLELE